MDWPGEKLVVRMWETLAEKGIGGWLRPGQIRREGMAGIELKRAELLALAQAEREAHEIKLGIKNASDFPLKLKFASIERIADADKRVEPTIEAIDVTGLIESSYHRSGHDFARKEINVAKAILHAEEKLIEDTQEATSDSVDDDWLYRWRDYAGDVGSDDMQRLWGRLLAGEVKKPGTYSLRCLEFLRSLDQADAKLIEQISNFAIESMIWKDIDDEGPLPFPRLMELDDLGILSGVIAGGVTRTYLSATKAGGGWIRLMMSHNKCLVIKHDDPEAKLEIEGYVFTSLGRQLLSLGSFNSDVEYLKKVGSKVAAKGFRVTVADYNVEGENVRYFNGESVS
ncbi:DUF2806 domain-containing protein [Pseudomonas sp. 21615526]|uniref:DUF2806 domain-containing protein n=1 Tax=Pseudomonas sp. 21615526 TaxID=2738811 RepID=UPI0015B91EA9|nr:DUF2806 domain-containing protein [Pseudomonas sp. 21615526]NVZ38788.1 DUF2806 domain-containing protein [Pseudomonas sp. 21615526]